MDKYVKSCPGSCIFTHLLGVREPYALDNDQRRRFDETARLGSSFMPRMPSSSDDFSTMTLQAEIFKDGDRYTFGPTSSRLTLARQNSTSGCWLP